MTTVLEHRKQHLAEKLETMDNVRYLINPSSEEIITYSNQTLTGIMRIELDYASGDFFVWDAAFVTHSSFRYIVPDISPYAKYGIAVQLIGKTAYFSSDTSDNLAFNLLEKYKKNKNFKRAFRMFPNLTVVKAGGQLTHDISMPYTKSSYNSYQQNPNYPQSWKQNIYVNEEISGSINAFFDDFWNISGPHMLDNKARILHNTSVTLYPVHDEVHISDIRALIPNHGNATKALESLKKLSDKHNIVLTGIAKPYLKDTKYITKKSDLIKWYKKNGFTIKGEDLKYIPRKINEQYAGKIYLRSNQLKYWKNPDKKEFYFILNTAKYNQVRFGIDYDTGDIYLWDGFYLIHSDFAKETGINIEHIGFYIEADRRGQYDYVVIADGFMKRDIDRVKKNKNFQRMMAGSSVFYTTEFDESINEQYGGRMDYYGEPVNFWINPQPQEIVALYNKGVDEFRLVVMTSSPNIYAFNALSMTHFDFCAANGIHPNEMLQGFLSVGNEGKWKVEAYVHDDLAAIEKNPSIRKLIAGLSALTGVLESRQTVLQYRKNLREMVDNYSFSGNMPVLINPTESELRTFLKNTHYGICRFGVDNDSGNLYFWDAADSNHGAFRRKNSINMDLFGMDSSINNEPNHLGGGLKLEMNNNKFFIYTDGPRLSGENLLRSYKKFSRFNRLFNEKNTTDVDLNEQYGGTFGNNDTKYWKNPNKQELLSLFAKYETLRFIAPYDDSTKSYYVWAAMEDWHDSFCYSLGFKDCRGGWMTFDKNSNTITIDCDWPPNTAIEARKLNDNKSWKLATKGLHVQASQRKLQEQYGGSFDNFGVDVKYWKNPSQKELDSLIAYSRFKTARISFDGETDDVYAFDAAESYHYKFYKETGVSEHNKFPFSVSIRHNDGGYDVVLEFDPMKYHSPLSVAQKYLMNNNKFTRMFGKRSVKYLEEEVVKQETVLQHREKLNEKEMTLIKEEAPTTNAGTGAVAGIGIGPQGEPGRNGVLNYRKMLRRDKNDNKKRIADQKNISGES